MGLIREFRSSLENPQTPLSFPAEWLLDIFNGGRTDSGLRVSEMTALQVGTVLACVLVLADGLASLDFNVYERMLSQDKRPQKRIATEHALYELIHDEPNPEMTSFVFRKTSMAHALLWGNAYAEVQRDEANRPVALWPRNPARTRPIRLGANTLIHDELYLAGTLAYDTSEGYESPNLNPEAPQSDEGPRRIIARDDMLHIPGLALDGRLGQSTVWLTRQMIGLALASEKFGAKFFGNGARAAGILTVANNLKPEAREAMKKSWQEAMGGENAFRPAVLEGGVDWKEISVKPNEGQFLETRQFQKEEICSVFRVPPHMIGMTEKQNRANTEQIAQEFVTFALTPWLKNFQQEYRRKLFPQLGRTANKYFVMFDTRPLIMPDAESRRNFYASGKQWGYLSTNMILEMEHLNPIDDPEADALWMPVNMQKMGADVPEPDDPGGDDGGGAGADPADALGTRMARAYSQLFQRAFRRICRDRRADSTAFRAAFLPIFTALAEEFGDQAARDLGLEERCQRCRQTRARHGQADHSWKAATIERPTADPRFLVDYLGGMEKRFGQWRAANGHGAALADKELRRAITAISVEVYRQAGTARAKVLAGRPASRKQLRAAAAAETPTVYVARHGATKLDKPGDEEIIANWGDEPLDEAGEQAARDLGAALEGRGITRILSSPIVRARQTADLVAEVLGLEVEDWNDLKPWNVGEFKGKTIGEAKEALQTYANETPDKKVPGGESFNSWLGRTRRALKDAHQLAKDGDVPLLVAHSRTVEALPYLLEDQAMSLDAPPPGSAVKLLDEGEGLRLAEEIVPEGAAS